MEDFTFPDPRDPKDIPWRRRIPPMYYWWGGLIILLTIAFIWLPSQCTMESFNLPQGSSDDFEGLEKLIRIRNWSFGRIKCVHIEINCLYGVVLSYHENGKLFADKAKGGKGIWSDRGMG